MIKERADTTKDIYIIAYFIFIIYKNTYLCNRKYYIMVSALYFNLEIKYTHTHTLNVMAIPKKRRLPVLEQWGRER